jgi:DNA/RNA endonuclease YhcR with UshA esterase domain
VPFFTDSRAHQALAYRKYVKESYGFKGFKESTLITVATDTKSTDSNPIAESSTDSASIAENSTVSATIKRFGCEKSDVQMESRRDETTFVRIHTHA